MKKILLIFFSVLMTSLCVNAQVMKIYKGNTLVESYTKDQATNVVFKELPAIIKVTSITVTGSKLEINVGESLQLSATVSPSNATNKSVTWSSSNASVATVSSSGLLKAVKAGSVTITATAQDGSGVKGTNFITVLASSIHNGHEYVDLGLPSGLKWATCNVGASKPEDYGDYFAWGETTAKSKYDFDTYKWYQWNPSYYITKYCTYSSYGKVDNKTTLELSDDAAHANWGGSWRMPTMTEFSELCKKCKWEWKELNGKKGYKVTGPNGNYIFLPAAGGRNNTVLSGAGTNGVYWSSTLKLKESSFNAYRLFFNSSHDDGWDDFDARYLGQSVRAVYH